MNSVLRPRSQGGDRPWYERLFSVDYPGTKDSTGLRIAEKRSLPCPQRNVRKHP